MKRLLHPSSHARLDADALHRHALPRRQRQRALHGVAGAHDDAAAAVRLALAADRFRDRQQPDRGRPQQAGGDLVFIDADLSWSPDDLLRLASYDTPFVAGVYQRKSRAKVDFAVKFGSAIGLDAQQLIAVDRVGTGFMRLRRDCIEKMVAAHPALRLKHPTAPDDGRFHALFDTAIVDGEFIGEDFTFCDRWRAIGGQVLVDPSMNFGHHGAAAYDEPLLKYLQRN
jgi:hypothetical protein